MDHSEVGNEHEAPASLPPEPVEDRPGVGIVTPEDYPEGERGGIISEPLDEDKEYERLNPGSGSTLPSVPGSAEDRDNA